jgi:hypothetical protein
VSAFCLQVQSSDDVSAAHGRDRPRLEQGHMGAGVEGGSVVGGGDGVDGVRVWWWMEGNGGCIVAVLFLVDEGWWMHGGTVGGG